MTRQYPTPPPPNPDLLRERRAAMRRLADLLVAFVEDDPPEVAIDLRHNSWLIRLTIEHDRTWRPIRTEIKSDPPPPPPKRVAERGYLTTKEACEYLRCSRTTLYSLLAEGAIRRRGVGTKLVRWLRSDLDRAMEEL